MHLDNLHQDNSIINNNINVNVNININININVNVILIEIIFNSLLVIKLYILFQWLIYFIY